MDYAVIDTRGSGWTVFSPEIRRARNLFIALYLAAFAVLLFVVGVIVAVHGGIWKGLALCLLGLAILVFQYFMTWAYYVAVDGRHVVSGRMRSRAIDIFERSDIAGVVWLAGGKVEHGVLCAHDGSPVFNLSQFLSRHQAAQLAQALDVPFVVHRPERLSPFPWSRS